ncbi:MAG: DUF3341 domain-containing protein [Nitrospiraceae bacterium]|nr:MAG: DUF3341 domain-containing protein [Nitrospiraceae bacterium]
MAKNIAVYGIYTSRLMVEEAVDALKDAGFRNEDISVLFPEGGGTKEFAVEKETKAPEGGATGGATGAVVGGALGWLVGIGSLAIPGLGPFIAAGPIMAALAGAGAGGAVGWIAGVLIGMGIPEYEANRYEGRVKEGGILLSVHADDSDWKNKGKEILKRTGAEDIGTKGEASADYDKSDRPQRSGAEYIGTKGKAGAYYDKSDRRKRISPEYMAGGAYYESDRRKTLP